MIRRFRRWRARRDAARVRALSAEFHQTAGSIPFAALMELIVQHAGDRRDISPEPMRIASRNLDRMADRMDRLAEERRLYGSQGIGEELLQ